MRNMRIIHKWMKRFLLFAFVAIEINLVAAILISIVNLPLGLTGLSVGITEVVAHPIWWCFVLFVCSIALLVGELLDEYY